MSDYSPEKIRNVVLASYPGAGKTSLCEALAFTAGAIQTMGSIEKGSTVADFEPEEIHRHHSVSSAVLSLLWKGHRLNLIDTPGSLDFFADTRWCLAAADAVVLVIGASVGIRTELERVWDRISELDLPCVLFINQLDKERTDFRQILEDCRTALERNVVPVVIPVGEADGLTGVIDLVHGAIVSASPTSAKIQQGAIPADYVSTMEEARRMLMEHAAETDDALVEQYLANGNLGTEALIQGIVAGARSRTFLPVFCGAALHNIGMHSLLDAMVAYLPSPVERAKTHPPLGTHPQSGEQIERHPDPAQPFSAVVFKTTIDPFMGRLTFIRVHSGVLEADSGFLNASRNIKEKGGHVFHPLGKKHTQTDKVIAGDIAVVAKLKETQTGDTICDDKHPIVYPRLVLPRPVMSFALEPKSKADIDKVSLGLHKLVEEDPSLEFVRNDETKEMLLSGVGQTHIDVTLEKLKRKYGVEVKLNTPKVPYKETIHRTAQAQGKYKKQTGGHGQYGDCWLQVDPLPRGGGFEFHNKIVGGVIPRNFIPAVEKGVIEALQEGVVAGYPVVDLRVTVYDGSHHPVDSSELAFKVAGSLGIKKALESAQPTLLEPMMTVEVTVPDDLVGTIIGDLNARRGRILGMSAKGHNQIIKACVPLAEMLKYAPALTSMTAGKGSYVMEFAGYEEVPRDLINKIVEESKREKAAVSS
ncbi:MAG: elongation factor G [Nitrospirae bacterium]|nr:MAG: elongation factor G [Nitrospirota bacterium]